MRVPRSQTLLQHFTYILGVPAMQANNTYEEIIKMRTVYMYLLQAHLHPAQQVNVILHTHGLFFTRV